jgi:hypothetical protein
MAGLVLVVPVAMILFAVGFVVGVLIVGTAGRWRKGRPR